MQRKVMIPLTFNFQVHAAIKWSISIKDDKQKHQQILEKFWTRDFFDKLKITAHVSPPTIAWVTLSKMARVPALFPFFKPWSPINEETPMAPVSINRNQTSLLPGNITTNYLKIIKDLLNPLFWQLQGNYATKGRPPFWNINATYSLYKYTTLNIILYFS